MADISPKRQTSMDIFRHVLDEGPLTLYAASTRTRFPLGTVHRHFKELESAGKIRVYHQTTSGRRKKMYGPTFYGIVYFARISREIRARMGNYFLLWVENRAFCDMLAEQGFDIESVRNNPGRSKTLFTRYVEYGIEVENQIEVLKTGSQSIPHEVFVFIGEILLASNPGFAAKWRYLYRNLPGLQRAIDANIENLVREQRQLKK